MTRDPAPRLPIGVTLLFRALLPIAEREEVIADLRAEYAQRAAADGTPAARRSAIGVAGAIAATRLLASLLYHVQSTDPLTLASAVGVLLAVGVIAAFVPGWRASVTDPAVVLRQP